MVKRPQPPNQMWALVSQRPILDEHLNHESVEDLPDEDRVVEVQQTN